MSCPKFLTLDEVAEVSRSSVATVRFWIRAGKLPAHKPGRRVLVRESDLIAFLTGAPLNAASTGLEEDESR